MPVTGFGLADAGDVRTGAASFTVTEPLPATEPLVARTVAVPALPGAVSSPLESTDPIPAASDQVKPGCGATASPNWSYAVAVNCRVSFSFRTTAAGET